VDRDTAELFTDELALPGVKAASDLETEFAHRLSDCASAQNCSGGPVECGEDPVAGVVDLLAAEAVELPANERVMTPQNVRPGRIASLDRSFSRADKIREENR